MKEGIIAKERSGKLYDPTEELYRRLVRGYFTEEDAEKILDYFDSASDLNHPHVIAHLSELVDLTEEELVFFNRLLDMVAPVGVTMCKLSNLFQQANAIGKLSRSTQHILDADSECHEYRSNLQYNLRQQGKGMEEDYKHKFEEILNDRTLLDLL